MRNAFIAEVTRLAEDPRVFVMLADNGIIVYDEYREKYPKQFLNVGIAESNMMGMAAGLASCNMVPFVYSISPFVTMRPYEYVRNDICYQNMNVKIVGIGAGFAYSTLGPTHHATEDISIMRCLPNMVVLSPADPLETRLATEAAYKHFGPVYLRIGTGRNPMVYKEPFDFVIGKSVTLRKGVDVTIISTGTILSMVLHVADKLQKSGISARVINIHTIKPIDKEAILAAAYETQAIVTIEEHTLSGGLGSSVAEVLSDEVLGSVCFKRMGLDDAFCHAYGDITKLRERVGVDEDAIYSAVQDVYARKNSKVGA